MSSLFFRSIGQIHAASAVLAALVGLAGVMQPATSHANDRSCRNEGSFSQWHDRFRGTVVAAGIRPQTIRRAYDTVRFDPNIIRRDRRQSFFSLSFVDFSKRLVSRNRLRTGANKLRERASWFRKAEATYGVPGEVITAFWALESDFGAGIKKNQSLIFSSLATLAYDCRRSEMFGKELISALRIVDRGYLPLSEMTGSWAGELGQTQFLPSHYLAHAVDADGDGRRDMIRSDPDIILSTANYINHLGWRAGEPWLEEVTVSARLAWREADLQIFHARATWAKWGVKKRGGQALPADRMKAALLLPMGRNGPAFLAYPNFRIYPQWNQSLNYAITAAYLATRLQGAPAYRPGSGPVENYDYKAIRSIQQLLIRRGYDTGGADGKMGEKTRAAVKKAQIAFGLPADSYPSPELIRRLQDG